MSMISNRMIKFKPLVYYTGCNYIIQDITKQFRSIIPINKSFKGLKNFKMNITGDIMYILKPKSIISAIVDLESNGTEITEIGIIVYDKHKIISIIHEFFRVTTETSPECKRFVHEPCLEPLYTFQEKYSLYQFILSKCNNVMAKGILLESKYFPTIKFIELNNIYQLPKMDDIDGEHILTMYNKIEPFIIPTRNQLMKKIDVEELRHNPAIECAIYWFILNNISPLIIHYATV